MKQNLTKVLVYALALLPFACSQKESCPASSEPKDIKISTANGSILVESKGAGNRISVRIEGKTFSSSGQKITLTGLQNNKTYSLQVGTGFACNSDTIWSKDTFTALPSVLDKNTMLEEVNRWWATGCRCGNTNMPPVPPLVWDNQLEQAAAIHSIDMAKRKSMSHYGSDGSTPEVRVKRVGYQWKNVGENVAYNFDMDKVIPNGWIKSEGHCKNIMNPDFKDLGMSVEFSSENQPYYTQVFGTRK